MIEQEIQDIYEFELKLAKLLVTEHWKKHPRSLKFTRGQKSYANSTGDIFISLTADYSDHAILRNEIRSLFADLHTNFIPREKFMWQRIAKKLNVPITEEPIDMCECQYCGEMTPLVHTKQCVPCYWAKRAVAQDPKRVRMFLEMLK